MTTYERLEKLADTDEKVYGFGEIGENCDFTTLRKGLAEFEVAFTNP